MTPDTPTADPAGPTPAGPQSAPTSGPPSPRPNAAGTIARGGVWAFGGLALGAAFQFGYNVIIARMYGASTTGIFAFVLSLTTIAAIVFQFGARETLLRYVSAYAGAKETGQLRGVLLFVTAVGMGGSLVAGALLAAIAPSVAALADKPEIVEALRIMAWTVPLIAGAKLTSSALQGIKQIHLYTLIHDVGRPLAVLVGLAVAFGLGLRFEGFLWLYLAATGLVFVLGMGAMVRRLPVLRGPSPEWRVREWLGFSSAVVFLDVFRSTGGWMDMLVLGFFVDSEEVGIYFAALRTALLITLALGAFNTILSPLAAEHWGRDDREGLGRVFTTATRWTWVVVVPVGIATILLRSDLMAAFGDEFVSPLSALVLLIILSGRFLNGLTGGVGRLLVMTGHERVELADTVLSMVLLLGGMMIAVPRYGLVGAAVVNAAVIAFINVLKLIQVWRYVGVQPFDRSYLKLIAGGGVAAGVGVLSMMALATAPVLVRLPLVALVVGGAFVGSVLAAGLEDDDRQVIAQIRSRLRR